MLTETLEASHVREFAKHTCNNADHIGINSPVIILQVTPTVILPNTAFLGIDSVLATCVRTTRGYCACTGSPSTRSRMVN